MTDTNAVFAAFIEASNALAELPRVKADLEAAQTEAKTNADLFYREASKAELLQGTIDQLREELARTEAALADATKSAGDSANLINGLKQLLGVDLSPVSAETKPEPSEPTTGAGPAPEMATVTVPSPESTINEMATVSSPTPTTEVANTATVGESESAPNPEPSTTPEPSAPGAEHGSDAPTVNVASSETAANTPKSPWPSKPYWINWSDWASKHNGEVPYWVDDMTRTD